MYIDSDTFVIDDPSDVFFLLEKYDIIACHDPGRNSAHGSLILDRQFPQSFPTLNGGLVGVRNSDKVQAFLRDWKTVIKERNQKKDQPSFRELLWDSDLKLGILPPEYNLMHLNQIEVMTHKHGVPKIIHSPKLHRHKGDSGRDSINCLMRLLGPRKLARLLKNHHGASGCLRPKPISREILFGDVSQLSIKERLAMKWLISKYPI
nr:putative nucleotide-diphospho-sugar transferase [Oceanobacter mangrovi]